MAEIPGVQLVSLQRGRGVEQLDGVEFGVQRLGPDLDQDGAFLDTAAIMGELDLIVSCDSAIGHLAGALDRPCFPRIGLRAVLALAARASQHPVVPQYSAVPSAAPGGLGPSIRRNCRGVDSSRRCSDRLRGTESGAHARVARQNSQAG